MPIYLYRCEKCGNKVEVHQSLSGGLPFCCGKPMKKLPTAPAMIKMIDKGGFPLRSKGYKEDYSKEYLKSIKKT